MNKHLTKLAFSVSVFIICLIFVEIFFTINSVYNWVKPRPFIGNKLIPSPSEISTSTIHDTEKKYADYKLNNSEFRTNVNELKNNVVRKINPPIMSVFKNSMRSVTIYDEKTNPALNKVIFRSQYEIDENLMRKIPGQIISKNKKNIILIGCSFAFGVGVNDNQTMSYFLKQKMPKYNVYNMSIPAAGMNDLLDDAFTYKRLDHVNKKGGTVVYLFFYDHLERTFCSFDCYRPERIDWLNVKNHYDFDSSGNLVNYGPRKSSQPIRYTLSRFIARSNFLRFIGYDMPKTFSEDDENKYVRMMKILKDHYADHGLDFVVYMNNDLSPVNVSMNFYEELNKNGIKYFTRGRPDSILINSNSHILGDGHFNEVGNYFQAGLISDYLKQSGY